MATRCSLSTLLGTLLISSLLLSTWTAQHGEASSRNMASPIMNRRLAVAVSRFMRGVDSDLETVRRRESDNLPDKVTNDATLGRTDNLVEDSESVRTGVVGNHDAEVTQTASNSSEQPQQLQLCEYKVVIQTGKQDGAGTDSDISLRLSDKDGDEVYFRHLANGHRTFERGHEDTFLFRDRPCVFDICRMVLYTDDYGLFSEWFVVNFQLSVALLENNGLLGPIVQERRWVINEWLPKEDDREELYTVRDDCNAID